MEGSPSACRLSDRVTSAQITAATHLAQALILVPLGHRRSECHCCGVLAARRVNPGDLHVVLPVVGRRRGRELVRLEMARLSRWEETIADGWKWRWHGLVWRTYILDDRDYWTIHPVINRKPSAEAGWED
jgi:hypothetical protein